MSQVELTGKKVLILYHADADGHVAGAVAFNYALRVTDAARVGAAEVDYDRPIPWDRVRAADVVIVVDFSLSPNEFAQLMRDCGPKELIWIDHHATAIRKMAGTSLEDAPGIRREGNEAGCLLAWQYFFPNKEPPRVVTAISRWDSWTHGGDSEILGFRTALEAHPAYVHLDDSWWHSLLLGSAKVRNLMDKKLVDEGMIAERVMSRITARQIEGTGYAVMFAGLRCFACNIRASSLDFDTAMGLRKEEFDVWMPYRYTGRMWVVSLYRARDGEADLGKLAAQFGGGGHPNAAGFEPDSPPTPGHWNPVRRDEEAVRRQAKGEG